MRRCLSLVCLAAVLSPAAGADIRNVTVLESEGEALVWLAFDEQPQAVSVTLQAGGAELVVTGGGVRDREIVPATASVLAGVRVHTDADGRGRVVLHGLTPWTAAEAEIRRGGILLNLQGPLLGRGGAIAVADAQAGAAVSSARPAPVGGAAQTAAPREVQAMAQTDMAGRGPVELAPRAAADTSAAAGSGDASGSAAPTDGGTPEGPGLEVGPEPDAAEGAGIPPDETGAVAQSPTGAGRDEDEPAPEPAAGPEPVFAAVPEPGDGPCAAEAAAVAAEPWNEDYLHAQAACLVAEGELAEAAGLFEQMLAFEPDNFRATVALADIREAQGRREDAAALYDEAARHAISDAEAARARARLRDLRNQ